MYFTLVFSRTRFANRVKGCPCTKPEQNCSLSLTVSYSLYVSPSVSFTTHACTYIIHPLNRSNRAHIRSSVSNRMRWRHWRARVPKCHRTYILYRTAVDGMIPAARTSENLLLFIWRVDLSWKIVKKNANHYILMFSCRRRVA